MNLCDNLCAERLESVDNIHVYLQSTKKDKVNEAAIRAIIQIAP